MGFAVTTRALATPSAQHESVREENNGEEFIFWGLESQGHGLIQIYKQSQP